MTEKFDLIEAYAMNKLSASESATLEAEMAEDSVLKNEVELQQDIISSIQEGRKAELKSRLAGLEVKPGFTLLQKVGLGTAALSALVLSIYLIDSNSTQDTASLPETINDIESVDTSPQNEQQPLEIATEDVVEELETDSDAVVSSKELSVTENNRPADVVEENTPANTLVHVHVPNLDNEESVHHEALNAPSSFEGSDDSKEIKGIFPSFESKNRKSRQYKYDGENLTLIGDFNSQEPYYIIEKTDKGAAELFLKFNDAFYSIKETKKPTHLEEVTNPSLLDELIKK